jgi:hypothetical protein
MIAIAMATSFECTSVETRRHTGPRAWGASVAAVATSTEGVTLERSIHRVIDGIQTAHGFRVADRTSLEPSLMLGSGRVPTLYDLAQTMFVGARYLTVEEQKDADARVWNDLKPIKFAE